MNKGSIQEMNTIGIDISKAKIDCAWLRESGKLKFKVFPNTKAGCIELIEWSLKNTEMKISELHFIMEATGIYHEQMALGLYNAGAMVSVANPAQVKFYAQGLGVRTKNDKKDSSVLARYGLKETPKLWHQNLLKFAL
jgi:transposase